MRILSLFVLLVFGLGVIAPAFAQPKKISDDEIYDQVRRRLATDRDVRGGNIEVEVKDGVVTLSGAVREPRQKNRAEHVTRKVKGVTKVVNDLKVVPTAP